MSGEELVRESSHLESLANSYHRELTQAARTWLAGRGIKTETIEKYLLGYVEKSRIGFKDRNLLDEHFANRLVVPVRAAGRIVDLVGMSLSGEAPLYKNVQGTMPLFGEEQLDEPTNGSQPPAPVFLCEDPIDALFLQQQGLRAVSCFGGENFLPEWTGRFEGREVFIAFYNHPVSQRHREWVATMLARSAQDIYLLNLPDGIPNVTALHSLGGEWPRLFEELVARARREGRFRRFVSDRPYLTVFLQEFVRRHQGSRTGYHTGWPDLDELLSGGVREGIYVLAGQTGVGKTSWLRQLADQIAAKGVPVLYATWELSAFELWARSLARRLAVPVDDIFLGRADPDQVEKANTAYDPVAGYVWTVEANMEAGPDWLAGHLRQSFHSLGAAPVVIVDSLDRLVPRRGPQGHVFDPLRDLRQLARAFSCPIICGTSLGYRQGQEAIDAALEMLAAGSDVLMQLEPPATMDDMQHVSYLTLDPAFKNPALERIEGEPRLLRLYKNKNGPIANLGLTFLPKVGSFR